MYCTDEDLSSTLTTSNSQATAKAALSITASVAPSPLSSTTPGPSAGTTPSPSASTSHSQGAQQEGLTVGDKAGIAGAVITGAGLLLAMWKLVRKKGREERAVEVHDRGAVG